MESKATSAAERRSEAPPTWFSKSSAADSAFSYSLPSRSMSSNKRSARSSSCAIRVLTRCSSARSRSSLLCKVRNSPRTSAAALAATGTGNSGSVSSPSASRRDSKSEICSARSSASGDSADSAESISSSSLRNAKASVSSDAITSESMNWLRSRSIERRRSAKRAERPRERSRNCSTRTNWSLTPVSPRAVSSASLAATKTSSSAMRVRIACSFSTEAFFSTAMFVSFSFAAKISWPAM